MNRRALFPLLLLAALLPLCVAAQTPRVMPAPPTPMEEIRTLVQSGKLTAALERTEALIQKSPRDVQARFVRAVLLADLGQTREAIDALEPLTQEFPELPEPHNNLGVLLAAQGKYELARASLQRALLAEPRYLTAYENLGDLYVAMAADAYRQATELDPKAATLQSKLKLTRELQLKLRPDAAGALSPSPSTIAPASSRSPSSH